MKKLSLLLLVFILVSLLVAQPVSTLAGSGSPKIRFNDRGFARTWLTLDKAVQENSGAGRGFTWGPPVRNSETVFQETYNGAPRIVQYFDKARMEVNNFQADPSNPYYVTTGLLVKELVTGQRQDGDNTFTALPPSTVQVAGDPNFKGGNTIAPTYASFRNIVTVNRNENGKSQATGTLINTAIDRTGNLATISPVEKHFTRDYDPVTRHNIADVFSEFGKANGSVWDGKNYTRSILFYPNATYVLGRPVTEPLWIRAVVGGVEKDVLVQLFERRVLTYTPSNPAGWKVEMGNVGQHYFQWRYLENRSAALPSLLPDNNTRNVPVNFSGRGKVFDQTFFSRAMNAEETYRVYLPPDYASGKKRYPVLFMLHGRGGSLRQWTDFGLLDNADNLMNTGKIQPFIIVMPDCGDLGYWMNQANGGPRWADYVAIDLADHIDGIFRTVADPADRAIGGVSMGGHGALQIAFNYPAVFGIIGAHSPALRTKEQAFDFFGDADYYATVDPVSIARDRDVSGYKIWIDIGQDDKDWVPRAQEFHQLLADQGVAHIWNLWPGDHSQEYWSGHIRDYLNFYNSAFPTSGNPTS